jgi:type I restriction enzyme M protein
MPALDPRQGRCRDTDLPRRLADAQLPAAPLGADAVGEDSRVDEYVSDKYAGRPHALIEIPKGGSFDDIAALKGDKEIGDKINKIIGWLAEANDLKNVIDVADFNDPEKLGSGKEMQDRLSKLVAIFEGLDFRANSAEGDDLLGDAYEYLMRHFATESGKSKGQFYTPAEVSRIMAKVVGVADGTSPSQTIYDPTCGSGLATPEGG